MQIRQRSSQVLAGGATALALLLGVPAMGAAHRVKTPSTRQGVRHLRYPTPAQPPAEPVVHTKLGDVSGTPGKVPGVSAYLGIPFAAPPVGDLRWRAPQPAAAWKGTRAADHFSPSCIQGPNTPFGPWTSEFLLLGPTSEDCLYLNVWTAAKANARKPVLVYIY